MSFIKIGKDTIKRYDLLSVNDVVVIGVSGGPDSTALALLLNSVKREFNLHLCIAHLDHQLRKDSYRDKNFVESLARRLNLPFVCSVINVSQLALKGSVEEIARQVRFDFLFSVARKTRANKIALGHNQDDQAETVLMRLIRGTGLLGLGSILPKRRMKGYTMIRPLIEIPRKNIEAYLKRRGIKARIDYSNKDIAYFRNRIRNRLIPELIRDYNPNIKEVLANMAQIAAYDYDYLENTAIKELSRLKRDPIVARGRAYPGEIRLNLDKLLRLHTAILRLILRLSIAQVKGSSLQVDFRHIKEIEDLIYHRPAGSIVDLPQRVSVSKRKNYLCIYRRNPL